MKNRNTVSLPMNASDSFEVYTANVTPENHNLHMNQKVPIPTIRLTQATPSDTSIPSVIAPKSSPRKKIVPKKSKLALLSTKAIPPREKDLSDIVRRVNASTTKLDGNATCNVTVNGGTTMKMKDLLKFKDRSSRSTIDIYVDPADDPDIGEIVVVKKKKSRAKLDGLFEDQGNIELKEELREENKWWSIRGRKKERQRNHSLNALKVNVTEANTVFSEARQRCGSTPLSPSDSGYADSIALRAMKSIARIGSWAQLKNSNLPRDTQQIPPGSRVKSSISSFEIGALSTHTGEDLTNRLSPMGSLSHRPPGSHKFLNPSITNTSVRTRTSSCGTVLSVTSPYLQPCDNRRLSTSSSSGESNRPGSTYTASGEDTGAIGIPVKTFTTKSKKGMSVKWGSVSSALALAKGKKKSEKEKLPKEDKPKERNNTSKSSKRFPKAEDTSRSGQNVNATASSKDKEEQLKKHKNSHRHTIEGRKRTHVMSVFPGLTFGRSADLNITSVKASMPPIAEDPNRSCERNSQHENINEPSDCPNIVMPEETWPARNNNASELSDSDSDLWNRGDVSDEEACVRLSIKNPRGASLQITATSDALRDNESSPAARPRPRPRPASEQLLSSNGVIRGSRPAGIVVDIDIDKYKDKQDVLALSVLEAANSDLASLINRLDLEATPDKDRDITASYADAIAAWRASGSTTQNIGSAPLNQASTAQQPGEQVLTRRATCSPADERCSVFRECIPTQEGQNIQLAYRDPIVFLDPTVDPSADSAAVGESFAFINSASGALPEDSPLRLLGKVRAITRAMGAATGATSETMSKRFSAISASTRASVSSLRPYNFATFKNKDENMRNINEVAAEGPNSAYRGESDANSRLRPASDGQEDPRTMQSSRLSKKVEVSSRSSVQIAPDIRASLREAPINRISRASSIASTFGTRAVLAKKQPKESATLSSLVPSQSDILSHKMSDEEKPPKFALPPLGFASGSPVPLYPCQFGTEDSPTPPTRARGHIRQSSGLVPISQRPIPRGSNVRRKVEYIEQLARSEHEQERKEMNRKRSAKHTTINDRFSTSSHRSDSSRSRYSPSLDEGISLFVPGLMTANGEGHRFEDESGQPDSDIPNELKDVLSVNSRLDDFQGPSLSESHSQLYLSSTSASCTLPPSPGLPPTGPLPIPASKSTILPTPASVVNPGVTIEPSPPAPSLLPVIDPSPSPETFKPSLLLPTLRLAPPLCEQTLSDDGDVEEFIPSGALRNALSTSGSGSEDDTKQSFDFTGELKRLNESGGSHRLSFVEQLDAAFKTPPHVTARKGLQIQTTALEELAPGLISTLEGGLDMETEEGLSMMVETLNESMNNLGLETSRGKSSSPMQMSDGVIPKPSYGRLDTAFKFGGRPPVTSRSKELALNSVALELPGVAALSTSPSSELNSDELPRRSSVSVPASPVEEDSSVLRSIYVHAAANNVTQLIDMPPPDVSSGSDNLRSVSHPSCLESKTSSEYCISEEMARAEKAKLPTHARQSSDVSFLGFSSFGAIRTKFEFGPDRPDFYSSLQTSQASMMKSHLRHESLFSIASVSSYGEVIKPGMTDPFNYGTVEDEEARDQLPGLDSFSDHKRSKRFSTDSDVSSFYFRSGDGHGHARNQSVLSTNSINGPPISLYNRTFNHGHRRNDSGGSMSSVAAAYSIQGANGGRAAWMRHQQERSVDSTISEFSRMRLGRPGVGDKMFESIGDHYPLSSISASPPESVSGDLAQKSSYDSILDDERRSTVDSIFDNTGHRSSISSDSVFWHEPTNENDQPPLRHHNLFPPPNLFRPLSLCSTGNHEPSREDDTMITMLGGEHVRRRSLGSSFEASPCFRVEKQKREFHHDVATDDDESQLVDGASPTAKIGHTARFVHDDLSASAKSIKFGETRMSLARKGLLHRESLEDSCLSAEGEEDLSMISTRSKTFSRPAPRRQRKPVVTITQPPDTTPPLSSSDGSGESQSSIDVERLSVLLQTAAAGSRSSATRVRSGSRIRAPGQGHRRRASQISKGSMIGTIHEEVANESPRPVIAPNNNNLSAQRHNSLESNSSFSSEPLRTPLDFEMVKGNLSEPHIIEHRQDWEEEQWVVGLRKYYALRSEADEEIRHSRTTWPDTPFSLHALHTFVPPRDPAVMQALLEHSVKNYAPLPTDRHVRRIRSRASSVSRSVPYTRPSSSVGSSGRSKKSHARSRSRSSNESSFNSSGSGHALRPKYVNDNVPSPRPILAAIAPFSPFSVDLEQNKVGSSEESFLAFAALANEETSVPLNATKPDIRPRVPSATRRTALGWSKRKTKDEDRKTKNNNNKENETHGLLVSPSESLRIIRPRPRSRAIANSVNAAPRSMALLSS